MEGFWANGGTFGVGRSARERTACGTVCACADARQEVNSVVDGWDEVLSSLVKVPAVQFHHIEAPPVYWVVGRFPYYLCLLPKFLNLFNSVSSKVVR
jgi:hypothetical protein